MYAKNRRFETADFLVSETPTRNQLNDKFVAVYTVDPHGK